MESSYLSTGSRAPPLLNDVLSMTLANGTRTNSSRRMAIFPIPDGFKISKPTIFSPQPRAPTIRESEKRLNFKQVQNILFGKTGTEDINLTDFKRISFEDNQNLSSEPNKNRIWCEMLNYTKGNQKDGKLNHFIFIQKVKKEIVDAIKETKPHQEIFLNNYNVYTLLRILKLFLIAYTNLCYLYIFFKTTVKVICCRNWFSLLIIKNKTNEEEKKIKMMIEIIADK